MSESPEWCVWAQKEIEQLKKERDELRAENEKLRAYNENSMVNKRNIGDIIIENTQLRALLKEVYDAVDAMTVSEPSMVRMIKNHMQHKIKSAMVDK